MSFIAAYAFAQYFGALLGPAWLGTFLADRQEQHYAALAQHVSLADPQVVQRLSQLGGSVAESLPTRPVVSPRSRAARAADGA